MTTNELVALAQTLWGHIHEQAAGGLTPKQYQVYRLIYLQGFSSTEAGALLGIIQSTVWKTVEGNDLYGYTRRVRAPGNARLHGGIHRKLRRHLAGNRAAQELWSQLLAGNAALAPLEQINLKRLRPFFEESK